MRPTARSERLALSVQAGLALLEAGVNEADTFDAATSTAEIRVHLSDIGEARFLPRLMMAIGEKAPNMQVTSRAWSHEKIPEALDNGHLHFAIGFLPGMRGTAHAELLTDRYQVFLRAGHPIVAHSKTRKLNAESLSQLNFVAVRSHAETARILAMLRLEPRIKLTVSNFLALPPIVRATDLAVLVPRAIGLKLEPVGAFEVLEPDLPQRDFSVALYWSRRRAQNPMLSWTRETLLNLFQRDHTAGV